MSGAVAPDIHDFYGNIGYVTNRMSGAMAPDMTHLVRLYVTPSTGAKRADRTGAGSAATHGSWISARCLGDAARAV